MDKKLFNKHNNVKKKYKNRNILTFNITHDEGRQLNIMEDVWKNN